MAGWIIVWGYSASWLERSGGRSRRQMVSTSDPIAVMEPKDSCGSPPASFFLFVQSRTPVHGGGAAHIQDGSSHLFKPHLKGAGNALRQAQSSVPSMILTLVKFVRK